MQTLTIDDPTELQPREILDVVIPPAPPEICNFDESSLSRKGRALALWQEYGTTPERCLVLDQLADYVQGRGTIRTILLLDAVYWALYLGHNALQDSPMAQLRFRYEEFVIGDALLRHFGKYEFAVLASLLVRR